MIRPKSVQELCDVRVPVATFFPPAPAAGLCLWSLYRPGCATASDRRSERHALSAARRPGGPRLPRAGAGRAPPPLARLSPRPPRAFRTARSASSAESSTNMCI